MNNMKIWKQYENNMKRFNVEAENLARLFQKQIFIEQLGKFVSYICKY